MITAYLQLHKKGHAQSVEVWSENQLVGGLYGISLGQCFFGESMFSREPDASKVALSSLVQRSAESGIELIDCQMHSHHLASLGSRSLPRAEFLQRLVELTRTG